MRTVTMSEVRIPLAIPNLGGRESEYLQECVATGFVSSVGPFVTRMEEAFAVAVGAPYAVSCASGTAALHVALQLAGVDAGDEVLVSDFTFIATVNPILYMRARPVLVDANAATWNIDPALVVGELDRRAAAGLPMPKAVLVAHVLGLPVDLAPIHEACQRHGVWLIEDAAEALGAEYTTGALAGRHVGTVGCVGCFSFNGNKIMTTGGGGMITTADATLARRALHLTTQARRPGPEYFHDEVGYNYRLTNLAAAVGLAQLEQLPTFIARKREIASRYDEAFRDLPGVTLPPRCAFGAPSMWLYSIVIDSDRSGCTRQMLSDALAADGIQTRPVWAPAHLMPYLAAAPVLGGAVGDALFAGGLSLPCSTQLSDEDQDYVIARLTHHVLGAGSRRTRLSVSC
jgi:dTDP-4-amino-4,6-dideoxygalactose transaminase